MTKFPSNQLPIVWAVCLLSGGTLPWTAVPSAAGTTRLAVLRLQEAQVGPGTPGPGLASAPGGPVGRRERPARGWGPGWQGGRRPRWRWPEVRGFGVAADRPGSILAHRPTTSHMSFWDFLILDPRSPRPGCDLGLRPLASGRPGSGRQRGTTKEFHPSRPDCPGHRLRVSTWQNKNQCDSAGPLLPQGAGGGTSSVPWGGGLPGLTAGRYLPPPCR